MGSPGIHHARTAARGSTLIRKMRNQTTKDPGPLSHTETARPLETEINYKNSMFK